MGFVSKVFLSSSLSNQHHEVVHDDLQRDLHLLDVTFDGGDRASKPSFQRGKDGFDDGSLMVLFHPGLWVFLVLLHHVVVRVPVLDWSAISEGFQ